MIMIKKIIFFILLVLLMTSFTRSISRPEACQESGSIFSLEDMKSAFHLNSTDRGDQKTRPVLYIPGNRIQRDERSLLGLKAMPPPHPGKRSENPTRKRAGRAFLLNYSLEIANSLKYWIKYSRWIEDWQFELNWEDQKRRWFTAEGYKFDSNPFLTNWTHILSGAIYYNFARYNMFNTLESTLFMLGANLYWEYVTEWREVISIGDNICTGIGGISIGEPLYWIGSYFSHKPGLANKILGFIFNPVVGLNGLLDRNKTKSRREILSQIRPDFSLYFGSKTATINGEGGHDGTFFNLGTEICFHLVREYGKPVNLNRYHRTTLYTELSADFTVGANSIEEYTIFSRAILFGWLWQKLVADGSNRLRGHSLILGAGTAFDFFEKKPVAYYDRGEYHYDFTGGETAPQPTEFADKMAVLNLIGPVCQFSLHSPDFRLRATAAACIDFGLVNSLAVNPYSQENDLYHPRTKTTLSYYGYYYALGFTLSSDMVATYRQFDIQGKFKYQYYDSIEGLDRFQEDLEDDPNVIDSRLLLRMGLGYSLPASPVQFLLAIEHINRRGTLKEITAHQKENRIYTQLKISF